VAEKQRSKHGGSDHRGRLRRLSGLVVVLALLAGLASALAAAAAGPPGPPDLAQAISAKDRHAGKLLARAGVLGTGVGLESGRAVVVVLTAREGVSGIPDQLDGVRVVVRVTGPIRALGTTAPGATVAPSPEAKRGGTNPASYFGRPVPIGVSTGNADECLAGTIGARVKNGSGVYALSNNHVYAEENGGTVGATVITQPGLYDLKGRNRCQYSGDYSLGRLAAFVPINFSTSAQNVVDAAIGATTDASLGNATPPNGYGTPSSTTATAALNMAVEKYGRTTGLTTGSVCLTNVTVNVGYTSGVARFVDQFGVCKANFSQAGDSGSLIVTAEGDHPVGLLFAGGSGVTFANPIDAVLSDLHVSVDGS